MVEDSLFYELHSLSNVSPYFYAKISASPKQPNCGNTNQNTKRHHPSAYNQEIHSTVRQPLVYQQQINGLKFKEHSDFHSCARDASDPKVVQN